MHQAFLIISFLSHDFLFFFFFSAAVSLLKAHLNPPHEAHIQQLCVRCFVPMLVLGAERPVFPPEDSVALKGHFVMYPRGGSPVSPCAPFLCECAEEP